jgi:hypothetical protein
MTLNVRHPKITEIRIMMCSGLVDESIVVGQAKFMILARTAISKDIKVFRRSLCR